MSLVEVKKKETRLSDLIDYRIRVTTHDGRVYIGRLMAFDAYMNLVMSDCIEEKVSHKHIKQIQKSGGDLSTNIQLEKRTFGLMILRGEHVLSTSVESPPLLSKQERIKLEKKNTKKLSNQKKARKGTGSDNGANKNKNGNNNSNTSTESLNKVNKPAHKRLNTEVKNGSRFNPNSQVRPSRFQAPPGFKKRT